MGFKFKTEYIQANSLTMTDYQVSSYFMLYDLPNTKHHYHWPKEEIPLIQVYEGPNSHILIPIPKPRRTITRYSAHADSGLFLLASTGETETQF